MFFYIDLRLIIVKYHFVCAELYVYVYEYVCMYMYMYVRVDVLCVCEHTCLHQALDIAAFEWPRVWCV